MNQIIPEELKQQAIQVALRKMFDNKYFDVCTFDKCVTLAGVLVPTEIKRFLDPLHCVYFSDMPKELRGAVIEAITITLGQDRFDLSFIDNLRISAKIEETEFDEIKEKKFSFLKKLINRKN